MKQLVHAAVVSVTAVAALSSLAACGSDNTATDAPSTAPSTSAAPTDTTSSSAAAPTDPTSTSAGTGSTGGDADTVAFCQAFADIPAALSGTDPDSIADAAHQFSQSLAAAPVPAGMPANAQNGLAVYISTLKGITSDEVDKLKNETDLSALFGKDTADVQSFIQYVGTACASILGGGTTPSSPATP